MNVNEKHSTVINAVECFFCNLVRNANEVREEVMLVENN